MTTADIFIDHFAIEPFAARVLVQLHDAGGKVRSSPVLMEQCQLSRRDVLWAIRHLRDAMDPCSIQSEPHGGYRLSKIGIADCRKAIEDAERRAA